MGKLQPAQVFNKCKDTPQDEQLPEQRFRLVLTSSPEFGQVGRSLTEEQLQLLVAYLTRGSPGNVSYEKLYLAFTLSESEAPLTQDGAD